MTTWTTEHLFKDLPPSALRLFQIVRNYAEALGGVQTEIMKTQVSFGTHHKFAWVWLPQQWTSKRPQGSITLTFSLDHEIDDDKHITEVLQPVTGKWTHHIVLEDADDFDDSVKRWLKESWEQSQRL